MKKKLIIAAIIVVVLGVMFFTKQIVKSTVNTRINANNTVQNVKVEK